MAENEKDKKSSFKAAGKGTSKGASSNKRSLGANKMGQGRLSYKLKR